MLNWDTDEPGKCINEFPPDSLSNVIFPPGKNFLFIKMTLTVLREHKPSNLIIICKQKKRQKTSGTSPVDPFPFRLGKEPRIVGNHTEKWEAFTGYNSSYALLIFKEGIGNFNIAERWSKIKKLVVTVRVWALTWGNYLKKVCFLKGKKTEAFQCRLTIFH